MPTSLGTTTDGRVLVYDADLYVFSLDGQEASFGDVRTLDARNWIRWRAPELCAWFRRIDPVALEACYRRARAVRTHLEYRSTNPAVAQVDAQGNVTVCGQGTTEIQARWVNAAGPGAEGRLVTIHVDERALPDSGGEASYAGAALPGMVGEASHDDAPDPFGEREASTPSVCDDGLEQKAYRPASVPPMSHVMKSYRSKNGKLAKDKLLVLNARQSGRIVFRKVEGPAEVSVLPNGELIVRKGLKKGVHIVVVEVAAEDDALSTAGSVREAHPCLETITVTLTVK